MNRRRTPGRPQLRQRCSSGEEDSEDEVLAMPRLGISLTPDDAAREEDLLEVFAREAVMFEFFECVDREAIFAGSDEFPDSFQDAPSHAAILLQLWRGESTCRERLDREPENRTSPSGRSNAFDRVSACSYETALA